MEYFLEKVPEEVICQFVLPFFTEKELLLTLSLVSKGVKELCGDGMLWKSVTASKFRKEHLDIIKVVFQQEIVEERWENMFQRTIGICRHVQKNWESFLDDDDYDVAKIRDFFEGLKLEEEEDEEDKLVQIFMTFQQLLPLVKAFGENNDIIYRGEMVNDLRHGVGKLEYPDQSVYEGQFYFGKKEGKGVFRWGKDNEWNGDVFTGDFEDDQINGHGYYTYANGDKYEGHFQNVRKQGTGSYFFGSGASYIGEWKNDMRNGHGIFTFHKFNTETGEWNTKSITDAKELYIWGQQYDGEWKSNTMHGIGSLTMLNGDKYIGEFKKDKIGGNGTLFKKNSKNTEVYEGYFEFQKSRGTLLSSEGIEYIVVMDEKGFIHVYKEDEEESEGEDDEDEDE